MDTNLRYMTYIIVIIAIAILGRTGWFHTKISDYILMRFKFKMFMIKYPRFIKLIVFIFFLICVAISFQIGRNSKSTEEKSNSSNIKGEREIDIGNSQENKIEGKDNNTHTYDFVIANITWEDAYQKCMSKGCHLLSIDSEDEYKYIINEIENNGLEHYIFYVGAYRPEEDVYYYWTNENGYLNDEAINDIPYWMNNEPSFEDVSLGIDEHYSDLFYFVDEQRWVINDIPNDIISVMPSYHGRMGYICEYE